MEFQLRHLTYFVSIAEQHSFSRAAAKLGISQPSLSQRINTLEQQLGFPLFVRAGRTIALTREAEVLLEPFRELVDSGKQIERLARNIRMGEAPYIRIGATMYSDRPERAQLITKFFGAYPNLHIDMETIYTQDLYEGLLAKRFDLGFSVGPAPDENIQYITVQKLPLELLLRSGSRLATKPTLSIADLREMQIVTTRAAAMPSLFDVAISPLQEAGAELIFPPDQTQVGLLNYGQAGDLTVAMPFPFLSNDALAETGFVRKQIADLDVDIALRLLRPQRDWSLIGQTFWEFTRCLLTSVTPR